MISLLAIILGGVASYFFIGLMVYYANLFVMGLVNDQDVKNRISAGFCIIVWPLVILAGIVAIVGQILLYFKLDKLFRELPLKARTLAWQAGYRVRLFFKKGKKIIEMSYL